MKALNKFSSLEAYNNYINNRDYITPNISLIDHNGGIYFNSYQPISITYNFIDLGLPSGTLWCEQNIGAQNDYDSGLYFSWANTIGISIDDDPSNYNIAYDDGENSFTKYMGDIDNKYILDLEDDAANVIIGNGAHIPSPDQWVELSENCTKTWITNYNNSGVNGILCTSDINDNSIFLPAAGKIDKDNIQYDGFNFDGNYQSNETYHEWDNLYIKPTTFTENGIYMWDDDSQITRYWIISIRAVKNSI